MDIDFGARRFIVCGVIAALNQVIVVAKQPNPNLKCPWR